MKKASMIFWILLFILPFTSSCFSQQPLPKGVFVNAKGDGSKYFDISFIDDTNDAGDWYYFGKLLNGLGRETTEYIINSFISQTSWPSAINSKKKREMQSTNEKLLRYTMYVVKNSQNIEIKLTPTRICSIFPKRKTATCLRVIGWRKTFFYSLIISASK